ncbi:GNAT family N-acetyltransferase [uncultured Clostridium sp.]|uniref:GNAT family N-acetyltransferase n=1 Tax=uncultured Clostridium sp. TaxID=59620 RepID=UPI0025F8CA78|nr:GNAT family N-acetyltransferase [uncultured Clostridium sp.]
MEFRKTVKEDINKVMNIIRQAQYYFKEQGIDQWQNNYPNIETIQNDIDNGISYVLLKDGEVVATAAVSFDKEKTYNVIYEGQWLSNEKYAVIHRVAVDNNYKGIGLSSQIIDKVCEMCRINNVYSIKIDTHEDNKSMQKMIEKNHFKYCGKIILEDGNWRIAFEKIIR